MARNQATQMAPARLVPTSALVRLARRLALGYTAASLIRPHWDLLQLP
jgi:hypothetical protein